MKIAVCDDSNYDKHRLFNKLQRYCASNFVHVAIAEYDSGEALLENFTENMFDIIFLDICMAGLNGIDTAKNIREIDSHCLIVFVTSSREYALDGFAVNAIHYLIKPVSPENIAEVFKRCQTICNITQQYIEVISERIPVKVFVNAICFIEVYDKASFIHTDSEVIKTYLSLEEITRQLDRRFFLRCHRSYIVNMRSIANVSDNDFILKSGKMIPIRQSEKQRIKKMYTNFLFSLARKEHHVG